MKRLIMSMFLLTLSVSGYSQGVDLQQFLDAHGLQKAQWPENAVNIFEAYIQCRPSEQEGYAIIELEGEAFKLSLDLVDASYQAVGIDVEEYHEKYKNNVYKAISQGTDPELMEMIKPLSPDQVEDFVTNLANLGTEQWYNKTIIDVLRNFAKPYEGPAYEAVPFEYFNATTIKTAVEVTASSKITHYMYPRYYNPQWTVIVKATVFDGIVIEVKTDRTTPNTPLVFIRACESASQLTTFESDGRAKQVEIMFKPTL